MSAEKERVATVDRLEPDITGPDITPIDSSAFYASVAISLRRQADALEVIAKILSEMWEEEKND